MNTLKSNNDLTNLFQADPTDLISEASKLSEVLNNISDVLQAIEDNLREINANFPFHLEVEKDPESNPKKPDIIPRRFPIRYCWLSHSNSMEHLLGRR